MPTYHFLCNTCGSATNQHMPLGATEKPLCKTCKKPMKKIVVPPTVHFKGSGFYKNDGTMTKPLATPAKDTEKTTESKPADTKPAGDATATNPKPAEKKSEAKT